MTRMTTISSVSMTILTIGWASVLAMGCRDPREITSADGEMAVVVQGNNELAVDLYRQATTAVPGNLMLSPLSINAALSMTYAGAQGETEQQMADVLHVGDDEGAWHDNLAALVDDLSGPHNRGYTLHTANAVWGQDGVPFVGEYVDLMAEVYGAPLQTEDYIGDASGATARINGWVAEQTRGMIPALFERGDITELTRLVLANAIYFEADWVYAFDAADTSPGTFHLDADDAVSADMMSQTADLPYASVDDVQLVELPYQDDEIAMLIVLPQDVDGLAAVEAGLTADVVRHWTDSLVDASVEVLLPRFTFDATIPLDSMLQQLGMTLAFSDGADFTGMVAAEDMEAPYAIDAVRHKAFVEVDESGTRAAAATGVSVGLRSVGGGAVAFHADHPFLFLIRDRLTGAVLFIGRLSDPRG